MTDTWEPAPLRRPLPSRPAPHSGPLARASRRVSCRRGRGRLKGSGRGWVGCPRIFDESHQEITAHAMTVRRSPARCRSTLPEARRSLLPAGRPTWCPGWPVGGCRARSERLTEGHSCAGSSGLNPSPTVDPAPWRPGRTGSPGRPPGCPTRPFPRAARRASAPLWGLPALRGQGSFWSTPPPPTPRGSHDLRDRRSSPTTLPPGDDALLVRGKGRRGGHLLSGAKDQYARKMEAARPPTPSTRCFRPSPAQWKTRVFASAGGAVGGRAPRGGGGVATGGRAMSLALGPDGPATSGGILLRNPVSASTM